VARVVRAERSCALLGGALAFVLGCTGTVVIPAPAARDTGSPGGTTNDAGATSGSSGTAATSGGGTTSGSGGTNDPTAEACAAQTGAALKIGRSRLSRLTRTQLDHTLRDLLGVAGSPASALTPDETVGPFASNALAVVTDLIVEQQQELAAKVALDAQSRRSKLTPCDLATGDACVKTFITTFGTRAYRRPLLDEEIAAYTALYALGGTPDDGFRLVLEAMLQSPFFLYHADVGPAGTPSATPVSLTPYELASRLSYFIWDSMPDQALFDLAASGRLDDDATLRDQVARMLADPRAKDAVPLFVLQWLDISPAQFGSLASAEPDLAQAMLAEASDFSNDVILAGDGRLSTLFTAPYSFPRGALFDLYGSTKPAGFKDGTRVMLDGTERAGLLTQAGFLVKHYRGDQEGSVVHRGITIRENLLCTPLEPPPANVMATPLPAVAGTTARDRFAAHETGACAGCHTQMDPIGLAFENYDGLGRYRTTDGGVTIDASGEIVDGGDLTGPFTGVVELGQKLAQSRSVADCAATQWFRFALGRIEAPDDACSLKALHDTFAASGYEVRALVTALALSDAFRHVRAVGTQDMP
jgi:hypothetical protein